jgi:hypothetical protein
VYYCKVLVSVIVDMVLGPVIVDMVLVSATVDMVLLSATVGKKQEHYSSGCSSSQSLVKEHR